MKPTGQIVIVGAGVFGLTTALQLAREGHKNIIVLDRHTPPVSAMPICRKMLIIARFPMDQVATSLVSSGLTMPTETT